MPMTPGPWKSADVVHARGCNVMGMTPEGPGIIAWACATGDQSKEEIKANARAIAALPLLIVALKDAIQELERSGYCFDHPSLEQKRSALAAAGVSP